MNKIILLSFVLITFTLSSNAQNNSLSIGNNKIDDNIRVPIYLNNSINVGSLQIRLDYDPASISVYSDPIMDKGDLADFYAPDNSHNKSGYITITTMKFGSGGLSGNLTVGYVRSQAIGGSGNSVKITPSILAITDDSGKDIIESNVLNAANTKIDQKIVSLGPSGGILTEPDPANMVSKSSNIDVDEGSMAGGSNRSNLISDPSPAQTIMQPETKSIDSGFSGIVGFTVFIIGFIIRSKLKRKVE
jgi:hypothetical protein